MFIAAVLACASCLIRWRDSWTPRIRITAAVFCLIWGGAVYWFAAPERLLGAHMARASEIRVTMMIFHEVGPVIATIRDPAAIAELAGELTFTEKPWELVYWFTPGGEHQLVFTDSQGRPFGHINTFSGGGSVMTRFPLGGGQSGFLAQLGHSDHNTSDRFQSVYRRVVLEAFLAEPESDAHPHYCWIVRSILLDDAYPLIIARIHHEDVAARRQAVGWLQFGPAETCVPALRELLDDPDTEVRAKAEEALGSRQPL